MQEQIRSFWVCSCIGPYSCPTTTAAPCSCPCSCCCSRSSSDPGRPSCALGELFSPSESPSLEAAALSTSDLAAVEWGGFHRARGGRSCGLGDETGGEEAPVRGTRWPPQSRWSETGSRLLKRLDELIIWARMNFKPQKLRSLSLRKGERNDRVTFTIGGEDIPRIVDQPIRSLGRLYTSRFSDKDMGKTILQQLSEGLSKIDSSQLPRKHKVWCYHFTLYPRVMWPLKLCEVTSSAVSRMEAKANSFICKWLGLPRCFSAAGLYGRNSLQLPLKSITLGYRQEKARLVMDLRDSSDRTVKEANARVATGRKWRAEEEVQKVMGRL
ncbi:hypothetical protein AAFF_G00062430 [Aldrovandia affinis]|uniref:Uncharacterized protein n=1 Tax=Aldrovandia affinis TaxID=143900 RepID=A0AAD7WDT4_9TELE|nr:hypothetical protein AAFF_G00062430 [Aldrovandia affinis]